jgi:voltage-gated potassium channel
MAKPPAPPLLRRRLDFISGLRPEWLLAAALVVGGAVNIERGLRYNLVPFSQIKPLAGVAESLAILGSSAQVVLGAMLVLAGIGLFWRLAGAWIYAVLLLSVTVAVNLFRQRLGASLILPAVLLLALLVLRRYFTRRTIFYSYMISLAGILSILAYGTFGTYLLGAGFKPPISDLTAAFYFTIITLATVGYGDIIPVTPETRLFVVSLIVVGLSIFATALATVLGPIISRELDHIFRPKEEPMKPKNHVILAGDGPIACNTARELILRAIPFVQIMGKGCEPALPDHPVVRGHPSEDAVLKEAGIEAARMVIAAREDDGENAFIALVAKDLNPEVQVLAVASSAESIRRLRLARVELVFAPAVVGSRLLANLVEGKEIPPEFKDLLEGKPRKV